MRKDASWRRRAPQTVRKSFIASERFFTISEKNWSGANDQKNDRSNSIALDQKS